MIFFRKSYQKLLFALSLCLCFFSQNVFGQHGFSQTSNYLSQTDFASVELNFRNAEDPQDPDPIATVKYEGGGVFQSGQSVEFSWEEVEIYQGGPNGYEEPGDGTSRTDSTQLTDNHYVDNRDPAWSPDGEWIAWAPITDEGSEIWIMRTNGTDKQRLAQNARTPVWAPDSERLVFSKPASESDYTALWTICRDGTGLRQITYPSRKSFN